MGFWRRNQGVERVHVHVVQGAEGIAQTVGDQVSQFKKLLDEDGNENFWRVLPVLYQIGPRQHAYSGEYRLMEHIGRGRWLERQVGGKRELEILCTQHNKEDYHTPLTNEEVIERERFSVMERFRGELRSN